MDVLFVPWLELLRWFVCGLRFPDHYNTWARCGLRFARAHISESRYGAPDFGDFRYGPLALRKMSYWSGATEAELWAGFSS